MFLYCLKGSGCFFSVGGQINFSIIYCEVGRGDQVEISLGQQDEEDQMGNIVYFFFMF